MESSAAEAGGAEAGNISSCSGNIGSVLRFKNNPELIPEDSDLINHIKTLNYASIYDMDDDELIGNFDEYSDFTEASLTEVS